MSGTEGSSLPCVFLYLLGWWPGLKALPQSLALQNGFYVAMKGFSSQAGRHKTKRLYSLFVFTVCEHEYMNIAHAPTLLRRSWNITFASSPRRDKCG